VELRKEVFPRVIVPCGNVRYVFTIANSSAAAQSAIDVRDTLPPGFVIKEITRNPYGGLIRSGVGSGVLHIEDLTLIPGIDSIVMQVTVGDVVDGYYKNQAMITGLPQALGYSVRSDDPTTIIKHDSTALYVRGYEGTVFLSASICRGELVVLNAKEYGTAFSWENGSTQPTLTIAKGGIYQCIATTACDTLIVQFDVTESFIEASFDPDVYDTRYGDTVTLTPLVINAGDSTLYRWLVPEGDAIPCSDCPQISVTPYRDTEYNVLVENEAGCQDIASVLVKVDRTRRVFAPNVFSPNGDGTNDEFFVRVRGVASINKFSVFDRWGNTLYTATTPMSAHPEARWSGRGAQGQMMQPGVFVWVAEVRYSDGSEEVYNGDVTLVR
jgi:gliding motility-associated-like protein